MSGLMASPWRTMSSPVLTMAAPSSGGTKWTSPRSRRAAPTPPARTATPAIVFPALGRLPGRSGSDAVSSAPVASGDGPFGLRRCAFRSCRLRRRAARAQGARCIADARSGDALELPLEQGDIGIDHEVHQFLEGGPGLPPKHLARLGGVAHPQVDLG